MQFVWKVQSKSSQRSLALALALTLASVVLVALLSCGGRASSRDPWLQGLLLTDVTPGTLLPFSAVQISGAHFVDPTLGKSFLHLQGDFESTGGVLTSVDLRLGPLWFVDFEHMEFILSDAARALFPSPEGMFRGEAWAEVESTSGGAVYASAPMRLDLALTPTLQPVVDSAQSGLTVFVNDRIAVMGSGFFLSESEGQSIAKLTGCVRRVGSADCLAVAPIEIPLSTAKSSSRDAAEFTITPNLVGIHEGSFEGSLVVINRHAQGGSELRTAPLAVRYEILPPTLFTVSSTTVSLGKFLGIVGGGFVSPDDGDGTGGTEVFLIGSFSPAGTETSVAVDLLLLPDVLEGRSMRYVINEDDALGRTLDLRRVTGSFEGTLGLRVSYGGEEELGAPLPISFTLAPVKQVVYLRFLPDYVNTLRHFGLRALDRQIRERVVQVVTRDYTGVNLEVRVEEPRDFALFSTVDVSGRDLNGLGLFGYDNTPGKDIGNVRLYDHIGGVNAVTQKDGYPGFGGVFIESMFAFSQHPKGRADSIASTGDLFDSIFDPFRPDMSDGSPVRASDLSGAETTVPTADPGCPASDRKAQIQCSIWVLGNIVGSTVSHEIAHSLGLANPDVPGSFHNDADEINRLMDSGGDRPFAERAQLRGEGPGMFCRSAYDYLREILPSSLPANYQGRESCF